MKILSVDLLDDDKILVSYEDGETALYEASQLRTLKPLETAQGEPGFSQTHGDPVDAPDNSSGNGHRSA